MGLTIGILCLCLVAGIIGYTMFFNSARETGSAGPEQAPVASSILDVTSTPDGAQVFVDSAFKGTTPVNIPLPPGSYEVRLESSGPL